LFATDAGLSKPGSPEELLESTEKFIGSLDNNLGFLGTFECHIFDSPAYETNDSDVDSRFLVF